MEILAGVGQRDYYVSKINAIKQDIKDNEGGIRGLYHKKSDLIKGWAQCLEELHDVPTDSIANTIVSELVVLDCKRGVKYAYEVLDSKYKRDYKRDLSGIGNEEEEKVGIPTIERQTYVNLPNEVISLSTAPPDDLRENQEFLSSQIKELKRREQEYSDAMRERHIAKLGQKEAEIEGTPKPYDPVKGHFYDSCVGFAEDLREASDTFQDISEKIEYYPPASESEDKKLADGIEAWRTLVQWINEHSRPYADLKFSQSYPDWFATEVLNRDYGKHAAAVKSKIATLSGGFRGMTREQVGDKIPDLADKALHMRGMFELANKAFELLQKDMPQWRKKRLDPAVGTRKENVGPKLSEAAFGSDKDK